MNSFYEKQIIENGIFNTNSSTTMRTNAYEATGYTGVHILSHHTDIVQTTLPSSFMIILLSDPQFLLLRHIIPKGRTR